MKVYSKIIKILPVVLFALSLYSCAPKTDLSEYPVTNNPNPVSTNDTSYVQQSPTWDQFNGPEDILIGKEPLIYVADTKNNAIIQMDLSGLQIGSLEFLHPHCLSQDNNFDLLVIADSVLSVTFDTVSVLYRVKTVAAGGIITTAEKIALISSDYPTPLTSRQRKFTGISTFPDNTYIVSRKGPNNSSSLDPDNAILKIRGVSSVTSVSLLTGFQAQGNGVYSIDKISSLWATPSNNTDFLLTRNTDDYGFKLEWFQYDNVNGAYLPKYLPEMNSDITRLQLSNPEDVTLDNNSNIFVVDAGNDSLYKFNSSGKILRESFGGRGTGTNKLNRPYGVAFFNKVLYIADTGNNRIVRYKLSTELN
ncbi:hypothetical protein BH10BAC5_BH10BAC5_00940 [soil metagenome]